MARLRFHTLILAAVLVCSLGAGTQAAGAGGDRTETIRSGGVERTYHIHLPQAAQSGRTLPLVLVFHGGGGTGMGAARLYGFNQLAEAQGFAVIYPEGRDRRWNDGRGATDGQWLNTVLVDDVGFVSALIDHLADTLPIDPRRVYATGMSNGGILSHRLACELSGKIAAIAPVAGTIAAPEAPRCALKAPVSVVEFHGTEDRFVPYGGGEILRQPERGRALNDYRRRAHLAGDRLDSLARAGKPPDQRHRGHLGVLRAAPQEVTDPGVAFCDARVA